MLAPLNRVEINTFLYKLPERTELSQECDTLPNSLQDIVNLAGGRKSSNTKPDAAMSTLVTVS